ncbi:hypothetical protein BCR41DRAFT_346428 [Lobosporangium transversale]|uniref:FAD-binding domain-containing protein n=1 Tax=Lobosporangium transversale TaxID=64571 RepID=A0A1Y2H1Y6_9FUNG|nr:hypothetical protein BCR41DRAFT_346428 [Lobosporangium transversale]ORZ28034.1 hypothetical protein BCR41DRAFT_346428 [Lobosporangium transversale]|eukprot:XP_021885737.1 hypothetical protein BCR41DRAFT_346428 [Lobosporangium transversale]
MLLFINVPKQMIPIAGLGAQSAMLDAVVLANYLHHLTTNDSQDIERILNAYRNERYPHSRASVNKSASMAVVVRNSFAGSVVRWWLNHIPRWLWHILRAENGNCRPQISFLPLVEDRGYLISRL